MSIVPSREEALFSDALAQPPAERGAFLAKACGADVNLLARLISLVAAHEGTSSALGGTPAAGAIAALREEQPGELIGHYKLLQKLGEGGCGVVWMAEQEEPVRRRVALKIIKLGMDTKAVVARFEAERQALAMMDHPNIAKVLDGGATDSGRPYFVMELVRGIPITQFCDAQNLPTRDRLELFIQVCHAIQHAHQKGIIHRDIKPSNVLVTLHDEIAVPMVIDFGIAKATHGRLTDQTLFTAFEQFIGTPVYMSPEQAEFNALDVDTRSDIYSLGVLLYELLTGRPPFDPKTLRDAGIDEMRRIIRETEPARPLTHVRTLADAERTTVAKRRSTAPAQLSSLLRGDLDWIVLKALEKNRVRRYQTASAFAADIQRSLAHEVVVARPPSVVYRIRKFIARHPLGFAAAATAAVLMLGGLGFASISFLREKAARQFAVEAQRIATKQAARADLLLASRLLDEGKLSDGLAYLVSAARKDPENPVVAPRMLTTLAFHNFCLPTRAPLELPSPALAAAFSSDGRWLAVQGEDDVVRVIDVRAWRVAHDLKAGEQILRYRFRWAAKDPTTLVAMLANRAIVVIDAATGQPRFGQIRLPQGGATTFDLSPDAQTVAIGRTGEVWLFDARTGEHRATLPNGQAWAGHFDFSPNSRRIVTVHQERVRTWSVPDGKPLEAAVPAPAANGAAHATFVADGRSLFVWHAQRSAKRGQLFDAVSGSALRPMISVSMPITHGTRDFVLSPDGAKAAIARPDDRIAVFDLETGKAAFEPLAHDGRPLLYAFSADSSSLFTNSVDGVFRIWSMKTGRLVTEPNFQQDSYAPASLAPDGKTGVIFTRTGRAYRWRIGAGPAIPLLLPRRPGQTLRVNVARDASAAWVRVTPSGIVAIDMASGRETTGSFPFPVRTPDSIGMSAYAATLQGSGDTLIAMPNRTSARAWKLGEKDVIADVALSPPPTHTGILYYPNGRFAVGIEGQGTELRVWDLESGRLVMAMKTVAPVSRAVQSYSATSISPDERRVGYVDVTGTVRVCDIATAKELYTLELTGRAALSALRFALDNRHLLTSDNRGGVQLWDAASGRLIRSTQSHRLGVIRFEYAIDGRYYASQSDDGSIQVWDAAAHTPVGAPLVQRGRPGKVAFSPDGTRIAAPSWRGTARVWDVKSGLPLTEPLSHGSDLVGITAFSMDGRFISTQASSAAPAGMQHQRLWSAPPVAAAGTRTPQWLLRLVIACAGKRLTDDGDFVSADEELAQFETLRHEIMVLPAGDPYAEWARWFLAEGPDRPIGPGFTITPIEAKQFAEKVLAESTAPSAPPQTSFQP